MLLGCMVYSASERAQLVFCDQAKNPGRPVPLTGSVLKDVQTLQALVRPALGRFSVCLVGGMISGPMSPSGHSSPWGFPFILKCIKKALAAELLQAQNVFYYFSRFPVFCPPPPRRNPGTPTKTLASVMSS